jgi:hypothetical protein
MTGAERRRRTTLDDFDHMALSGEIPSAGDADDARAEHCNLHVDLRWL